MPGVLKNECASLKALLRNSIPSSGLRDFRDPQLAIPGVLEAYRFQI